MRNNKNRFIYMIIVGVAVFLLLDSVANIENENHNKFYDILISILITIFVWEGNLRIDNRMNQLFPWLIKTGKRIAVHLPISTLYSVSVICFPLLLYDICVCELPARNQKELIVTSIIIGTLLSFLLLLVEISTQFFVQWKRSLVEVEKYKSESLQAQFQNLKNQINPHFLFNNLSVLSSLVYKDQDKSVEFINQLSKVYRYLLESNNNELVTLKSEINFIKSYTYLLKIRFDTNISFDFRISEKKMNSLLPPMALQTLIENSIKHNEVSSDKPLTVSIICQNDYLVISNNLQLRKAVETSPQTGLKNIIERYKYFTKKPVEVIKTSTTFEVKIPLIDQK